MVKLITPKNSVEFSDTTLNIYHANVGEGLPRHEHNFNHLTICHSGSCVVRKEKGEKIINKNSVPLNLVDNEWHEIEALEDNTIFVNVFSTGT